MKTGERKWPWAERLTPREQADQLREKLAEMLPKFDEYCAREKERKCELTPKN